MTKAELENHRTQYEALVSRARVEQNECRYRDAVETAAASWDHIDGMMRYEKKYNNREFTSIDGIDIVLRYAPVFFDSRILEKLESLLRAHRRIEKNTSVNLAEKLSEARTLMWDARRLWNHFETQSEQRQGDLRRTLGGDQERWRWIVEIWTAAGVVSRTPDNGSYRLTFSTQLEKKTSAKCPSCAAWK
jgi:hypothetical protein